MDFSEQLCRWRKRSGVNQAQLGERLGIGQAAVSKYETGRSVPPPAHFDALRHHLALDKGETQRLAEVLFGVSASAALALTEAALAADRAAAAAEAA